MSERNRSQRASGNRGRAKPNKRAASSARSADRVPLSPDASLVKVAVLFFLLFAAFQTVAWMLSYRGILDPALEATAEMAGVCSSLTGIPATVSGNEIFLTSRILRIDLDCTGLSIAMVYSALVLAYPLSFKRKMIGLGIGLPALFLVNMARLTAVAQLSGRLGDDLFLFVHDYLFKIGMVAAVIGLWGLYLASARRHAT